MCVVESQFREDHIRSAENKGKCKVMWAKVKRLFIRIELSKKKKKKKNRTLYRVDMVYFCADQYSSHQSHAATETKEVNFQFYVFNFK